MTTSHANPNKRVMNIGAVNALIPAPIKRMTLTASIGSVFVGWVASAAAEVGGSELTEAWEVEAVGAGISAGVPC
ncbi:MAG TPA: hypothetical protein VGJ33_05855 [Candidatus Angelobacter sp.]